MASQLHKRVSDFVYGASRALLADRCTLMQWCIPLLKHMAGNTGDMQLHLPTSCISIALCWSPSYLTVGAAPAHVLAHALLFCDTTALRMLTCCKFYGSACCRAGASPGIKLSAKTCLQPSRASQLETLSMREGGTSA